MGLLGIGRGFLLTVAVIFALAVLKKLVIVFGLFFAVLKFGIVIAFVVLLVSILFAMCRKNGGSKTAA